MVPILGSRRSLPLAARLAAVLTVASFFVSLLVSLLMADQRNQDLAQEHDRGVAQFAADLAERTAPLLERGDGLRLSVLAALAHDLYRGRVLVLDEGGKVRFDTALVQGDRQLQLVAQAGAFQRMVEREGENPVREALVPVRRGGDVIGEVRLQYDVAAPHAAFPLDLFATVFLCCLSLVAVATMVGHHWLARIRRTTQALVQLASGEVGRTTVDLAPAGGGELQELQQAMQELDRGMQEGLARVADGFLALSLQLVDSLERRGLTPPGHGDRTARYAGMLAARLSLLPEDRRDLELACRVHDLGKAFLRPSVLEKQDLEPADQQSLRQHPVRAAAHLDSMPSLRRVAQIVRHQLECYGGSGQPDGLRGDRIPLGARILAIASVYDVLTVCAADDSPLEWQEALAKMAQDRGAVFDPWLLDLFAQEIRKSPPGRSDRPVMISPAGVVALRTAVASFDNGEENGEDLAADLAEELELMSEERPGEERP
jgi:HD-GYP domain-containing protein (c-di-GMP phosphodiesterase class II)